MWHFSFVVLSGILFLDSLVLVLLILLQLPKKEAGAGMAFGGSATDALFGAGSGNAMTTITKYSAGIFFGAALLLAVITSHLAPAGGGAVAKALLEGGSSSGGIPSGALNLTPSTTNSPLALPPATQAQSNSTAAEAVPSPAAPPPAPVPAPAPATNK
jgi:preprotein translocase subunit SecG